MGKPSSTRYDWPALKAEWLQGNESLNQFRIRKGIGNQNIFYARVSEDGWVEAKERIIRTALEKTEAAVAEKYGQEWDRQMKLWSAVEGLAGRIMTRKAESMDSNELAQLTAAIERALKAQRLILGQSTDNMAVKNYHMSIVQMLKEIKGEEIQG